ncbi:MAG TPA: PH domain-containing protein [Pseudonocardia sp.]|nr:PH domain-containing protein [Pseudonocardia sp.]
MSPRDTADNNASTNAGPVTSTNASTNAGPESDTSTDTDAGPDAGPDNESTDNESTGDDSATWRRLDPRVLAVFPLRQAGALVPLVVVLLIGGQGQGGWHLLAALAPVLVVLAVGATRWATVRYRVGGDRVELRGGLLNREQRSLRRDRVRTVDLRANPAHRLFRLTVVEIGTGSSTAKEGRLSLDAVTVAEGERLRRELLHRSPDPANDPANDATGDSTGCPHPSTGAPARTGPAAATYDRVGARPMPAGVEIEVARLHPSWLRFAPLTASGLVAVGAIVGTAFRVASDAGLNLASWATLHAAGDELDAVPLWVGVAVLVAAVLLAGGLGSLAIYLEGWWGYRLTREPDATLRLRRGLLTTRSLSVEQGRMRGAEVTESLPLRLARGARCAAITTGLDAKTSNRGALLPPAPREEAHRVAAAALLLADPTEGTGAALVRHPPAALRRRLTRAGLPAVGLVLAGWALSDAVPGFDWLWPAVLLVLPGAALLAADRYRNLGHALRPDYLVISQGSLVRRRVALQRRGIIGWRLRQSPFQRWAGLATLDAVTAAGAGYYSVVDVPVARAVSLVEQVNPGLLPAG